MSEVSTQTLHIVARELNTELADARAALEAFGEDQDNLELLRSCGMHLRQVHGALRIVEVYGAALLAEEMDQVVRYLVNTFSERRHLAEGLDALMRAMVQLPTYLERVLNGGRDVALVLLPLLNDLRAVRGSPLLSEGTLLLLNLTSDRQASPVAPAPGEAGLTTGHWARKLRPRFQLGLLGWIKGERVEQNLEILARTAEKLEQVATTQPVFQLWWVVGALIEALRAGGLAESASVKRLLGQADREMRRLYEQGEQRYIESPPLDLLNNLLYYVARVRTSGPRVSAVRASFRLGELLPVDEQVEEARESLSAPSVKLMKTVAAAIKEDLGRVKDALDLFVRKPDAPVAELAGQLELLKKIGDTLGVLGLGGLRERVQSETEGLQSIVAGGRRPEESVLLGMAATLISIEDGLDEQLVALIVPGARTGRTGVHAAPTEQDIEFRQVTEAVLRECIVNLARIKEAIALSIEKPSEIQALDQVPQLVRGITAGLLMLGKTRAVEVMEAIDGALQLYLRSEESRASSERLDRLADAIVSVEYYMETLQAGRSDPWYMLDNAESCIAAFEEPPVVSGAAATATVEAPDYAATLRIKDVEGAVRHAEHAEATVVLPPGEEPPVPRPMVTAVGPTEGRVDPEFLEIFIEESKDELERIASLFPRWEETPQDIDALTRLRRSFHTLKGSGRMVGALLIGEFAWAIESLLNRVINGTLERTSEMMQLLRDAVAVVPQLVEQLETGRTPPAEAERLIERARAMAGPVAAAVRPVRVLPAGTTPVPAAPPPAQAAAAPPPAREAMEPGLLEVYSKETVGHLSAIRSFLAACERSVPPFPVTEALHRACHTLSGTAKTAGASQGIKIAEPLNHYIRKLYDNGVGLSAEGLAVLRDAVGAIEDVVEHIDEDTGYFVTHGSIAARLRDLEVRLDEDLARLAEATATARSAMREQEPVAPKQPAEAETVAGPPPEQPPAVTASEPVSADEEVAPVTDEAETPLEQPAAEEEIEPALAETAVEAEVEPALDRDFDPDVAAIFTEEAAELLEAADTALQSWSRERSDTAFGFELKRALHTLKGGARMAGIRAMGDLSHELESFMLAIESGRAIADDRTFRCLQAGLDELHHMREAVRAGRPVPAADDLMARIRGLSRPPSVPARAPKPGPQAEAAAAVEPPPVARAAEPPAPTPEPSRPEPSPEPPGAWPLPTEISIAVEPGRVAMASPPTPPGPTADVAAELPELLPEVEAESRPAPVQLPGREQAQLEHREVARVDAELLDNLLNNAGEVSIFRARLEQQVSSIEFNLAELGRTVTRLRDQLRKLELETEAQVLHRYHEDARGREDFDPLELDRYSTIQQLSRALAESVSDVGSIEGLLENLTREAQNLLLQQSRTVTELQNGLMRTRMVPFQRHVQRLSRIVRQVAAETGKRAELAVSGASGELDRQVLERMLPPFEHMLRNAVVHGIESPEQRLAASKPELGQIRVSLRREGSEMVITIEDDGRGIDVEMVRQRARASGLIQEGRQLSDEEALQLILEPGFSTAGSVTQHAGRGVGMDVVVTEIKKLGGALFTESTPGKGTRFTIRLPFTLAISQALIVRAADELYALPLPTVEGVTRVPRAEAIRHLEEDTPTFSYGGQTYRFQHVGAFIGLGPSVLAEGDSAIPVVLIRAGEHSTALVTDELVGSREIVVKSVGPQIAGIRGISGATILGDGRIVVILDMGALVRSEWRSRKAAEIPRVVEDKRTFALVVDDSITVRRVTQRLLERNGMRVMTAKDGVDALSLLQEHVPDVILLDIEMPRMDGYELASHIRGDERLANVPIVMITSRVGEKHRARAIELGVNDYLGKPYQESQLLDAIVPLVEERRRRVS